MEFGRWLKALLESPVWLLMWGFVVGGLVACYLWRGR